MIYKANILSAAISAGAALLYSNGDMQRIDNELLTVGARYDFGVMR